MNATTALGGKPGLASFIGLLESLPAQTSVFAGPRPAPAFLTGVDHRFAPSGRRSHTWNPRKSPLWARLPTLVLLRWSVMRRSLSQRQRGNPESPEQHTA